MTGIRIVMAADAAHRDRQVMPTKPSSRCRGQHAYGHRHDELIWMSQSDYRLNHKPCESSLDLSDSSSNILSVEALCEAGYKQISA